MVQYYTLQEAAARLQVSVDQLKEMAKNGELRAFQDRGNMRFRSQEVDELARLRGLGSDPDLPLSDSAAGAKSPRPAAPAGTPDGGVFDFSLGSDDSEEVPIGQDLVPGPASTPTRGRKSPSPKSPGPRSGGPKSPAPASGDSDVRLVHDGGDLDFRIDESGAKSGPRSGAPKSGKSGPQGESQPDSGVRIVPLDQASDSDVKVVPDSSESSGLKSGARPKAPSDSDVRLEGSAVKPPPKSDAFITEEIDLDAEAARAAAESKTRGPRRGQQTMVGKGPAPDQPEPAPGPPSKGPKSSGVSKPGKEPVKAKPDTSSDFELTPGASEPLGLSDEIPLLKGDDEVDLGGLTGAKGGSGINLQEPADSGISLEQGGSDEIEFELSLDSGSTPKPGQAEGASSEEASSEEERDSSSDFELSLDSSSEADVPAADSDSEFELSLDADSGEAAAADSDSEFELTLDQSGGASPADSDSSSDEKDIFETDFEVPALDEESGSEAVALEESDTDLEGSSDFDLALHEGDAPSEEETGSQVVALEDEGADESAETVARPRPKAGGRRAAAALAEEEGELQDDVEGDLADEEAAPAMAAAPAAPADWGIAAPVGALLTFVVLFLVSLMSFELVQSMWGYHTGGPVSGPVVRFFAGMLDKDVAKE
jgi:excisionase family DNA binding protein